MLKQFKFCVMLFFIVLKLTNVSAQDSLIIQRDTFDIGDRIEFYPKIAETLFVPTLSCSCGDYDFMYKVYKLQNGKWNLFINHSEPEDAPKCTCKYFATQLKDGVMYSIDALKQSGTYYVELVGGKSHPVSKKFSVLEK
ncbi:MAG: hypothetical protein ACO1G9_13405 [Bacteroidota bacterium]